MICSVSRRGNCDADAAMENWNATVKCELGEVFHSISDTHRRLFDFIVVFYNQERLHSALGYQSPAAFERAACATVAARFAASESTRTDRLEAHGGAHTPLATPPKICHPMLALVSMESLVPPTHPLRAVKRLVDEVLRDLDPVFSGMYAAGGRPSVAPERLLKASVLMALYSVRSERLMTHDMARRFFAVTVERAHREEILATDHFSVDGTLTAAWGSTKSFRQKEGDTQDNKGFVDFRVQTRTNDTHESKTDPDARPAPGTRVAF